MCTACWVACTQKSLSASWFCSMAHGTSRVLNDNWSRSSTMCLCTSFSSPQAMPRLAIGWKILEPQRPCLGYMVRYFVDAFLRQHAWLSAPACADWLSTSMQAGTLLMMAWYQGTLSGGMNDPAACSLKTSASLPQQRCGSLLPCWPCCRRPWLCCPGCLQRARSAQQHSTLRVRVRGPYCHVIQCLVQTQRAQQWLWIQCWDNVPGCCAGRQRAERLPAPPGMLVAHCAPSLHRWASAQDRTTACAANMCTC